MSYAGEAVWKCSLCRYQNPSYNEICEICDSPSPKNKPKNNNHVPPINNNKKNDDEYVQVEPQISPIKPLYINQENDESNVNQQNQMIINRNNPKEIQKKEEMNKNIDDNNNNNGSLWGWGKNTIMSGIKNLMNKNNTNNNDNDDSKTNHNNNNQEIDNKNRWQCPMCTYLNHIDLPYCEACRHQKDSQNTQHIAMNHNNHHQNTQITRYQQQQHHNNYNHLQNRSSTFQHHNNSNRNIIQQQCMRNDAEIARKLQEEEMERQKQLKQDMFTAQRMQNNHNSIYNNNYNHMQYGANNIDDFGYNNLYHTQPQIQYSPSPPQREQHNIWSDNNLAKQLHEQEMRRQQRLKKDILSAQNLEQKYQVDDEIFTKDREIALTMQKEFAEGLAWFCASCFTMNLNIQSFTCEHCGNQRPKPKIPDVITVRDEVCMKIIEMMRNGIKQQKSINCIVNLALAQNFVTKYLQMCKERGVEVARPKICYHWTKQQFFDPIKKQGLKVPDGKKLKHATDDGYYGKGIYMSPDPTYAKGYGHGAKQFFAAISLPGKQFAAYHPRDNGCALKDGFDSHHSADSINNATQLAWEWVFFDPAQLLLSYHITEQQVQIVVPILNQVIEFLVSKYSELNEKGGIKGL